MEQEEQRSAVASARSNSVDCRFLLLHYSLSSQITVVSSNSLVFDEDLKADGFPPVQALLKMELPKNGSLLLLWNSS